MKATSFIILFLFPILIFGQVDPVEITKSLWEKMDRIESYEVDVLIKIEVDFIKMDDREAQIYYAKPDTFEIKSDDFILMPKEGSPMDFIKILKRDYSAIYEGMDTIRGKDVARIKVIPMQDTSQIILATIWVDTVNKNIFKIQSFTKRNGSYTIDFYHGTESHGLPAKLRMEFSLKGSMIPSFSSGDFSELTKGLKKEEETLGVVWLEYSNYRVKYQK